MTQLLLSLIIVTNNHQQYIDQSIASHVPEDTKDGGEVILIDNLSDDDSVTIASKYPSVNVLVNTSRRGFSANNNDGMSRAKGQYILLLNPDTEVRPGALRELISFMDTHLDVGMCGAQLLFPDGTIQPSPRRFPTFGSFIARRSPVRKFLQSSTLNERHLMAGADHSKVLSVDWLLGACMFIRREVLETVGPLDEGFYLYVEDIDWAKRIHQANWKICYIPQAKIIHHHLAISDKRLISSYTWLHLKSMVRYACKHMLPSFLGIKIKERPVSSTNLEKSLGSTL